MPLALPAIVDHLTELGQKKATERSDGFSGIFSKLNQFFYRFEQTQFSCLMNIGIFSKKTYGDEIKICLYNEKFLD